MSFAAIGSNVIKVLLSPAQPGLKKPLCKVNLGLLFPVLSSNVSGKAYRDSSTRPPPYPYKEKNYGVFRSFFDRTTDRFDENTKVIVVEGPVAAGKTAFAKELAEELDMLHFPEANMDTRYINPYGYDMRQLDHLLPESVQSFDEKKFCMNPHHMNVASFQIWMYKLRFAQYIDALAHLLSTGQGVVMERCPWSDMVFLEAMRKQGYVSKEAYNGYQALKDNTIHQLLRPHLIVYLDVPVDKVLDNIKKRNLPHEVKGKALTKAYLDDMELFYRTKYLKEISVHSELLMYDWCEPGNIEVVVEDIERIDFDQYTKHDKKLEDWRKAKEQVWAETRMRFADEKDDIMSTFNVPVLDAPELIASGSDTRTWQEVWFNAPGMKYHQGFNASQGDTGILFKTKPKEIVPY